MFSARNVYSPLAPIHPAIFAASPEHVRAAWREVQDTQTRWQVARDELTVITDSIKTAKTKDADNAAKAVAAGKPIPKSMELQANEAAHEKQREVTALAGLADSTERAFLEVLKDESEKLAELFTTAADEALSGLLAAFNDLDSALADYSVFVGAWLWLQGDMVGQMASKRVVMNLNGVEQDARAVLGWVAEDLRSESPSAVIKRRAEQDAAWKAEMAQRQIVPGVLADSASYRELVG
jgi:hypothetical protein